MKILFVVRGIGYSGAAKQLALTANAMAERGHSVFIYTYNSNKCGQQLHSSITYLPESNPPNNSIEEYLKTPFRIRGHIKHMKADIVIGWRTNAACDVVLATLGMPKVKTIFTERTDPYMEKSMKLTIARKICSYADGGVFQTEKARNFYKRLSTKSIVIPNPVNQDISPTSISNWENRDNTIVAIGRFYNPQKRFDVLLRAFKIVHNIKPDISLTIYGDGPDFQKIETLRKELGLIDCVRMPGAISGVIAQISKFKIMVMTSDYEGIPNTIIEAFQAGVPVVSTDCSPGGARVLIDNGENGYIVPIRNEAELANKICSLIDDGTTAQKFIDKSIERLYEWSPTPIFNKWESFLKTFVYENS